MIHGDNILVGLGGPLPVISAEAGIHDPGLGSSQERLRFPRKSDMILTTSTKPFRSVSR